MTFRTALATCTATVALAAPLATTAGAAPASQPAAATAASVNMEAVVKAAQIDPVRPDHTMTPGAQASVKIVEQALQAKGLLAAKWVDGYFGSQTVSAYAAYQKSLGYSGLAATGLPGKTSLTKLGAGRYTVTQPISLGNTHDTWGGKRFNTRTAAMLTQAQKLAGIRLTVTQGSYNPGGVGASGGTHDGGGAGDLGVKGLSDAQKDTIVRAMRQVGFAAWHRTPAQGPWVEHIHFVAISDTDLSKPAQAQVGDYYLGKNGLAGHGKDDGPRMTIRTWEEYNRAK